MKSIIVGSCFFFIALVTALCTIVMSLCWVLASTVLGAAVSLRSAIKPRQFPWHIWKLRFQEFAKVRFEEIRLGGAITCMMFTIMYFIFRGFGQLPKA